MEFENLFQPITIGGMTVKNRIAMSPMSLRIAGVRHEDGTASDKLIRFWEARAKGGTGLIITDVMTPDPDYCYLGPTLSVHTDAQFASMQRLTSAVHSHGAKIIPQLTHPGPASMRGLLYNQEVFGPTKTYNKQMGTLIRELSIAEIEQITEQFGDTAKKAKEAGFDGAELHVGHAYMLLGSFLSPARNKRTDRYGGTLEGRLRFPLDVIKNIRAKAGKDFAIIIRMSGDEIIEDGNHLPEMTTAARAFCGAGADALEISGGAYPEYPNWIMPCHGMPMAINANFAEHIKKAVDVPVLIVGGIRTPAIAEELIETGVADMTVMGRALLADPELPNKALAGDIDAIAPCTGCSDGCLGAVSETHTTCVINPAVGEEKEMELVKAETPKKVLVIGGGPGGMMAARDCALRGHHVTLLEKKPQLGGLLNAAARPPFKQEVTKWIKYLIGQMQSLDIDVRLNQEGGPELIGQIAPDAIVTATGSEPILPHIPGLEKVKTVTAADLLNGDFSLTGGRVLIIGGGIVALETADMLSENVRPTSITIMEMLDDVGKEYFPPQRALLLNRFKQKDITIHTSTQVKEITEEGVVAVANGSERNFGKFDTVVIACGFKSSGSDKQYEGLAKEIFVIGDASKPRTAMEAIAEGAKAARQI